MAMTWTTPPRPPRGMSIVELMIALVIILVTMIGFVGAMGIAVNSTAVAHRRTEATLLRSGLIERLTVARRSLIDSAAGAGWVIESCYDAEARLLPPTNDALAAAYACPAGAVYARHLSAAAVPDAAGLDQRVWSVAVYVDRLDRSCAPADRFASLGCVAADLYLTD
jgi:Tfp pilus assembly protein PilV